MTPGSFCGSCGSVVKHGALYCGSCGAPTPGPAAAAVLPVPPPTMIGTIGAAPPAPAPVPPQELPPGGLPPAPPPVIGSPDVTGYASFGKRSAAYVIDAIPNLILLAIGYSALIAAILGRSIAGTPTGLILVVVGPLVYLVLLWAMAAKGSSPGNAILGIRVIRESTGAQPGVGLGLGRLLLKGLLIGITLTIGGFSPLWDKSGRRKGWWDAACGTVVLDRNAVPAYRAAVAQTQPPSLAAMSLSALPHPGIAETEFSGWAAPKPIVDDRPAWDLPPVSAQGRAEPVSMPAASWNDQPFGNDRPARADPLPGSGWPGQPASTITRAADSCPDASPSPAEAEPHPEARPTDSLAAAALIRSVPGFVSAGQSPSPAGVGIPPPLEPDRLDHTRMRVAPQAAASPVWRAALDDGRMLTVDGPVMLGRDPSAGPAELDAVLVPISDRARSVSKTHLLLEVGPAGIQVMDRHSTNGVVVVTAGVELTCVPGVATPVPDGSTVRFGDRSLVVRRA